MSLHINKPYKIISSKEKRYNAHYNIPSANCLVVPLKILGDEAICDIRWEDQNGEMQVMHNKMFIAENLIPLNQMVDASLYEIWDHYYKDPPATEPPIADPRYAPFTAEQNNNKQNNLIE